MAQLELLGHSTVYRNPHPNSISEYVAFPALQAVPGDVLLCMCRHGVARESPEGGVKIHRSTDGGETWQAAGALPAIEDSGAGIHLPGGFGISPEEEVLAWVCYPQGKQGESGQLVTRSADSGLTWSEFARVGTAPFESIGVGGNLVTLADGCMVSVSEWGEERSDERKPDWASLITFSSDGGRTWGDWRRVHGPRDDGVYFFDMRITGLADGRLLAVYWTHDMEADQGINVHTSWSGDGGASWSAPQDARFWGQVTDVAALQSGRVIAVTNHRREPLGIRALLSEDGGGSFAAEQCVELWGIEPARVRSAPVLAKQRDLVEDLLESYHFFTFGTPSVTQLSDGTIVVAFYVTEEQVTYVQICRMREIN